MFRITMENLTRNSSLMETMIYELKNELNLLTHIYKQKIKAENNELTRQIESAKNELARLETQRGIVQVLLPHKTLCKDVQYDDTQNKPAPLVAQTPAEQPVNMAKTAKQPKEKKEKPKKPEVPKEVDDKVDVGRLDLRIGKIVDVKKHPDADSLYVSQIECGDQTARTVVSGLVKFVPIEELKLKSVVVLCNLKPAKMRGITSEAMVMCASTPEKVEVLCPPPGAEPGEAVLCEGYDRRPDAQLNPKKKIFETVAPDLKTNNDAVACYMGKPLTVAEKGQITASSLKNVNIK